MADLEDEVRAALEALRRKATNHDRENMVRFGIRADKAFGVSMANLQAIARPIGRRHDLAQALWETGWYEARMLASLIGDPRQVTSDEMERWCADFDNWGIVDSVCFKLWDEVDIAFDKVEAWANHEDEFQKRAAFALLASLSLHRKGGDDAPYLRGLELIEREAGDDRNFVKKGANWALRAIGLRKSPSLKAAALATAERLATRSEPSARWNGKDALRQLRKSTKPKTGSAGETS